MKIWAHENLYIWSIKIWAHKHSHTHFTKPMLSAASIPPPPQVTRTKKTRHQQLGPPRPFPNGGHYLSFSGAPTPLFTPPPYPPGHRLGVGVLRVPGRATRPQPPAFGEGGGDKVGGPPLHSPPPRGGFVGARVWRHTRPLLLVMLQSFSSGGGRKLWSARPFGPARRNSNILRSRPQRQVVRPASTMLHIFHLIHPSHTAFTQQDIVYSHAIAPDLGARGRRRSACFFYVLRRNAFLGWRLRLFRFLVLLYCHFFLRDKWRWALPRLRPPSGLVDATIDEEFARLLLPRYRKCVFGHSHNEIPGACLPPRNWIKDGKKVRVCRVPDCLNLINGYGFVCKTHGGGLCQWPDCTLYYQVRPCETPPLIPCIPSTYTHPPPPEKKGVTPHSFCCTHYSIYKSKMQFEVRTPPGKKEEAAPPPVCGSHNHVERPKECLRPKPTRVNKVV